MERLSINYHFENSIENGVLNGRGVLLINGRDAIVEYAAKKGDQKVSYHWEVVPASGFDFTVNSLVLWRGDVAAVYVVVTVFKDGGLCSTVSTTMDVCGSQL